MTLPLSYSSDHFYLTVDIEKNATKIKMEMKTFIISTEYIPHIIPFLENNLPRILMNKCFNYDALPFHEEVKKTEIGHLFEHMVLEHLCTEAKKLAGDKQILFNGITKWDWDKDKEGTFYITLDVGSEQRNILSIALSNSIKLINNLLDIHKYEILNNISEISSAGNPARSPANRGFSLENSII